MKRWIVLGSPLFIAILALGNPMQSWGTTTDNANSAYEDSIATKDTLNDNNVAVDNATIIEDNLNGPIGNDTQLAEQAANDGSIAVGDVAVTDVANDNSVTGNDTLNASQAANDDSIAVGDVAVTDVANDKSINTLGNDVQSADVAANDQSIAVKDVSDIANDKSVNTIGNDTLNADQAANEGSIAVKDVAVSDIANDKSVTTIGNDTQNADQAANDGSIAVKDVAVTDVANDKSVTVTGNDVQSADVAANDQSMAVKDTLNNNTLYDFANDKSDNSINTDNSINISDIQVAVAASVLNGQVTGNSISMTSAGSLNIDTGSNCLGTDSGSFTTTGISAVSMNTGVMSQTQQSINVQANLTQ